MVTAESPRGARRLAAWLPALWLLIPAPAVLAGDDALLELLDVLRSNGTITQEAYDLIAARARGSAEPPPSAEAATPMAEAPAPAEVRAQPQPQPQPQVQLPESTGAPELRTDGRLEFRSADGDFRWRLGGRLHADAAVYDDDGVDMGSGTLVRRARLGVDADLWRAWDLKLEFDFVDSGVAALRDAYLGYSGQGPWSVRVGHFKEPFGIEAFGSANFITFMERPLPEVFSPGRRLGLALLAGDRHWSAAAGVFADGPGAPPQGVDEGWGAAGRVTFAPIQESGRLLHLGLAGAYRETDDLQEARFRSRPESAVTAVRLVDTGTLDAESLQRIGAEIAAVYGPWALQSEYVRTWVARALEGNPDLSFDGWYLEGSWILTGESRPYRADSATMGGIRPKGIVGKGGWGAWQLAVRFSSLDLSDEDIDGGRQQNLTLGLNWYPTPNIRFMTNYVRVLDLKGGAFDGVEPDAFQARAQFHF